MLKELLLIFLKLFCENFNIKPFQKITDNFISLCYEKPQLQIEAVAGSVLVRF